MLEFYIIIGAFLFFGLIVAATSHQRLVKVYNRYYTTAYSNVTAGEFTTKSFRHLNMPAHRISISNKDLSDGYSISKKVVVLSRRNFYSKTVSALAVAAHELGHAMQHQDQSKLLTISFFLGKISRLNDILFFPGLLVGSGLWLFSAQYGHIGQYIVISVLMLFILSFVLKIINIPLEINASKRALNLLRETNVLDRDELKGAKKVLRAAGFTYFGSLFFGILKFIKAIDRSFK